MTYLSARTQEQYASRRLMYERIKERAAERRSKYHVELVRQMPYLADIAQDVITFLGAFVWTQPAVPMRYMLSQHAIHIGAWSSPADLARDYLAIKYPRWRGRCRTSQYRQLVQDKRVAPHVAAPCSLPNALYMDMQSAYWQILQVLGWNPEYLPGKYLAVKSDVSDYPFEHIKLSRNTLVSSALPGAMRCYYAGKYWVKRSGKSRQNLILWAAVQDVLHGIASDMVARAGAVYVNTDGYIIPARRASHAFEIASEWGVALAVKHQGRAVIRNVADYDIGSHKSRLARRSRRTTYSNLRQQDIRWLRKQFSAHAAYARNTETMGTPLTLYDEDGLPVDES
jgi:hypothetical protein